MGTKITMGERWFIAPDVRFGYYYHIRSSIGFGYAFRRTTSAAGISQPELAAVIPARVGRAAPTPICRSSSRARVRGDTHGIGRSCLPRGGMDPYRARWRSGTPGTSKAQGWLVVRAVILSVTSPRCKRIPAYQGIESQLRFRDVAGDAMTLHEVLERAAEMDPAERRTLSELCGTHGMAALPRTTTGGNPGPPPNCPICYTVFSPASFRPWNPAR
jgi:hypothetical protein